jgi:hypothetical protein
MCTETSMRIYNNAFKKFRLLSTYILNIFRKAQKFSKYSLQNEDDYYYDIHLILLYGTMFSRTDTHRNKIHQHQHNPIFWLYKEIKG